MPQDQQQWIGTLISFGVLALVLTLRMRRMRKAQRLRVERLWMFPALYALAVILLFAAHPPAGMIWIYVLAALAVGLLAGWGRGKLMIIHVDPQTHEVTSQGSMAAMLVILILVAVRYAARFYMTRDGGMDPALIVSATDVLLVFGLGFIAAQRLEMGMRAREMLAKVKDGAP